MRVLELPLQDSTPSWFTQGAPLQRNTLVTQLQVPTKIVCLGGGTGLPAVLKGLARYATPSRTKRGVDITAIVAMSDDGGSSGRLRRTRGLLPPGDIRNCLAALSSAESPLAEVFQYRFGGTKGLAGHALGNLMIAALAELKGDFLEAVQAAGELLGSQGVVLPSTLSPVELVAEMEDASRVVGERNICRAPGRVKRVQLHPRCPPPSAGILEALNDADLIVLGPGSLYSSLMPNLLVDGVADAMKKSRAMKVMVANLMTQPGETDGMSCVDHLRAVVDHVGPLIDVMLLNAAPVPPSSVEAYARKGAKMVEVDEAGITELGVLPVRADLLRPGRKVRHDPTKVARCLLKLARSGL